MPVYNPLFLFGLCSKTIVTAMQKIMPISSMIVSDVNTGNTFSGASTNTVILVVFTLLEESVALM